VIDPGVVRDEGRERTCGLAVGEGAGRNARGDAGVDEDLETIGALERIVLLVGQANVGAGSPVALGEDHGEHFQARDDDEDARSIVKIEAVHEDATHEPIGAVLMLLSPK